MLLRIALGAALALLGATASVAQERELVFSITEGVTYQATPQDIRDRFTPLAEVLARTTGRRVRIVVVAAYDDLRAGLARQEYDLAFVHPAHVSMGEIKAKRYQAVAWTTGFTEYAVSLLMSGRESWKSLADIQGRTLVTPDPDSITAVMVRAMFRAEKLAATTGKDQVPGAVRVITTRYQDAVPFYIENGFAQVGATAANAVVKAWTDKGGKVVTKSRSVPIKQFIVAARVPADTQAKIRQTLQSLRDVRGGREALEAVGYRGFVAPNPEIEAATIEWLGL